MKPTHDELEQWLDAALADYTNVEPRLGLETRVLAHVESERERIAFRRRWWLRIAPFAVAGAIALAILLVHSALQTHAPKELPVARQEKPTVPQTQAPNALKPEPKALAIKRSHTVRPENAAALPAPRLGQFPSPSPLSDQERMLARYVEEFPHRAALMARAQTELHKENERAMAAPWPENGPQESQPE